MGRPRTTCREILASDELSSSHEKAFVQKVNRFFMHGLPRDEALPQENPWSANSHECLVYHKPMVRKTDFG